MSIFTQLIVFVLVSASEALHIAQPPSSSTVKNPIQPSDSALANWGQDNWQSQMPQGWLAPAPAASSTPAQASTPSSSAGASVAPAAPPAFPFFSPPQPVPVQPVAVQPVAVNPFAGWGQPAPAPAQPAQHQKNWGQPAQQAQQPAQPDFNSAFGDLLHQQQKAQNDQTREAKKVARDVYHAASWAGLIPGR